MSMATDEHCDDLVSRAVLDTHLDAVHEAAVEQLLVGLLPAIEVAWADGAIQDRERELALEFARECGLDGDVDAMDRLHAWLADPPNKQECRAALEQLRDLGRTHGQTVLVEVFARAEAVARANGGVLGLCRISGDERRAIEWLEMVLEAPPEQRRRSPDALSPVFGVLGAFKQLLADRQRADTEHRDVVPDGKHTMWPQPCPWGDQFAPSVLGVPSCEYVEYMDVIVGRYLRSLKESWWDAICHAAIYPGLMPMRDEDLGELLFGAPFARFFCPTFDAADFARFGSLLEEARQIGTPYKVDMTHFARCRPLPGIYAASTVGLFALRDGVPVVVAIEVDGRMFRPDASESWERARYFLIQSCSVSVVLGAHPQLHFPMDSVIGVTREVVPPKHPLARVIEPHAWLHLPLDYGVMFNERSVAHNHQKEIYTPFPIRRDDVFNHFVSEFYVGTPGNSARPPYRYPMGPPSFPGPYAAFLASYYEVLLGFTRRVAAAIPSDDPIIGTWGAALHRLIPGFPSVEQLREPEQLARAICGFIHSVSVWHSADHHTYGSWPVNKVPQRLRVPPPTGDDEPVPLDRWIDGVDIVRQDLARQMFYEAHTVRNILEVDYGFEQPELIAAVAELHEALRRCDRAQPIRYIPLEKIACSLQF
jgi:hypothetical protein